MNKKVFSAIVLVTLLTISLTAVSCWNGIRGNGNVVKSDRHLSGFDAISVSTGLDLYLSQDSVEKVIVEADENLQDIIITEVRGGELKIYCEKNIFHASEKKVYVTLKNIHSLSGSAGAEVETASALNLERLSVSASSGSDVKIGLNSEEIVADASSGGHLKIIGKAQSIEASSSSGADINATDLICETGKADASSGGGISVYASEKVRCEASSGGHVNVYGNPKERDSSSSSGGNVSFK